jgi:hypothetical protein
MQDKRVFKAQVKVDQKNNKPIFEEKEFAVIRPSIQLQNEATKLREKVWNEAFQEGNLLRRQLDDELKKRKLWNNQLQAEYDTLQFEVIQNTMKLEKGGIKLNEARELAIDTAKKRQQMVEMLVARSELDNHTCEGQADNIKFNFLFANCLVYNDTGEKVYPNGLDEYMSNSETDYAIKGATQFYYLISDTESLDEQLPENKFLKKYNFVDNNSRFIERNTGRLITEDGKYIDNDGFYIAYNEDGSTYRVDITGKKLDIKEEPEEIFEPFLDDDGSPVVLEEKPKTKTRRKRTTKKIVDADA